MTVEVVGMELATGCAYGRARTVDGSFTLRKGDTIATIQAASRDPAFGAVGVEPWPQRS